MSDTDQLPDGVMRLTWPHAVLAGDDDGSAGEDYVTLVEGHGRAREMLIDARGVVYTNEAAAMAAHVYGRTQQRPGEMKRCIVIEMDNAATPQKGHQP